MTQNLTKIYCIANQKGGVGKTTTVVSLAAFLASRNQRVLIIDADPQSNTTSYLGIEIESEYTSLYDVLVNEVPLTEVILPTKRDKLSIVPSSPDLAAAEVEMIQMLAREMVLKKALQPVLANYDVVLMDTPPSLGILTINALTASEHGVLIPVQSEYLALEGLSQLIQTIRLVRDNLNPGLQIAGVIMTMFDARTKLAAQVVGEVKLHFPEELFEAVIPRSVRLGEAPSHGEDILAYAPKSPGALAYQAVADELLRRIQRGVI